jgi:hypothetical protein
VTLQQLAYFLDARPSPVPFNQPPTPPPSAGMTLFSCMRFVGVMAFGVRIRASLKDLETAVFMCLQNLGLRKILILKSTTAGDPVVHSLQTSRNFICLNIRGHSVRPHTTTHALVTLLVFREWRQI